MALSLPERLLGPASRDIRDELRGIVRTPRLVAGRTSVCRVFVLATDVLVFFFSPDVVDRDWQDFLGSSIGSPKLTFLVADRVSAIDVAGRLFIGLVFSIDRVVPGRSP